MGKVAIHRGQYETYRLIDNANQAYLEVVPERGGIITQWHYRGHDLLYLDRDRFNDPSLSVRGGIPTLFPICGNLPNDTYQHSGKPYRLPQHGFARNLPWTVLETRTEAGLSIVQQLSSNDETLALYPFEFQLTCTYSIRDNQLSIACHLENQSAEAMPFSLGFHPYFPAQDKSQLSFDLPSNSFVDQITKETQPFFGQFDFERDEIDVRFAKLSARQAAIHNGNKDHRWNLSYSDDFTQLVFWTVRGKDYVCLEPWTAPRNALNTQDGLIRLAPGSSHESRFAIAAQIG